MSRNSKSKVWKRNLGDKFSMLFVNDLGEPISKLMLLFMNTPATLSCVYVYCVYALVKSFWSIPCNIISSFIFTQCDFLSKPRFEVTLRKLFLGMLLLSSNMLRVFWVRLLFMQSESIIQPEPQYVLQWKWLWPLWELTSIRSWQWSRLTFGPATCDLHSSISGLVSVKCNQKRGRQITREKGMVSEETVMLCRSGEWRRMSDFINWVHN